MKLKNILIVVKDIERSRKFYHDLFGLEMILDNDGNMCYHIGIPYMMDAEFVVLNDIETTVTNSGQTWIITYTPDAQWFTSEERVYPILLDPSITTNDYVSNIQDTYVEENSTTNHSDEQYLQVGAYGYYNRNAIVRIRKLPAIDKSMPIISAKLMLTAQYSPLSDVALKAGYYDSGLDWDDYNYNITTDVLFTYSAYSYLLSGSNTVTFDFTSHIYEMYADEEYDVAHGDDYHGDFIIGYATSGDTTPVYPFFSSEYTTSANRPVFTVKYGYTLPAGMLDGQIYSFRNYGSYSYMSVNGAEPANNSNVYQVRNDSDIAATTQKFKLEYVPTTGGYLLRSMSSSSGNNKVVDIQRAGGEIYSGRNVQIYSATDPISQEWLIVPVDYDVFRVVPRANMALTLTAYGNSDGTNSGKTSTSPGNIFVQTFDSTNGFQKWYIYDNDDNVVSTQQFRSVIETGNYYLSNSYTGRYLHMTNNVADCMRGTISSLGDETVKWKIVNLGDGYCTIQHAELPHTYLAPASNSNGSSVKIYSNLSETIPENYKWSIRTASGGGCLIQHKESGYYLYAQSQSANPASIYLYPLYSVGSDGYKKQTWRIAHEDYYIELSAAASFNNITIDINETKRASVNKYPSNASWASYTDFDYIITSGSEYVTYDPTTHQLAGKKVGTASVFAVHKTTGLTDFFNIRVNNNAIIIVPGIMGTELEAGSNNAFYAPGTDLWSAALRDEPLEPSEKLDRILSLKCDSNGDSINDVVVRNNKYGADNTYKTLYDYLEKEFSNEYTIEFFAYDWRLSNAISATTLNTFINEKGYDNVILVCHSMGGLVASSYLSLGETQRNKVKQVIMLGSPLLGTSIVPYLWGKEDINVTGLLNGMGIPAWVQELIALGALYYNALDLFLCNFRSLYEMFPSQEYFESSYAGKSYLVTSFIGANDLEITTYYDTMIRLADYLPCFKTNHLYSAEAFHASVYSDSSHITELVDTYYIAGYNISTINKIEYDMWDWNVYDNTILGDSLVATWSATIGDRTTDRTFFAENVDHMQLVNKAEVIRFVAQLINGNTSVVGYTSIHTNIQ